MVAVEVLKISMDRMDLMAEIDRSKTRTGEIETSINATGITTITDGETITITMVVMNNSTIDEMEGTITVAAVEEVTVGTESDMNDVVNSMNGKKYIGYI